jgi:hypothetical protein
MLACENVHGHCCREAAALPKKDHHGNVVMVGRIVDVDASKFSYDDCLKSWFMVQDVALLEHGAVSGFVFVFDMKGLGLGHITKMSLSSVKKYYMYIQVQMTFDWFFLMPSITTKFQYINSLLISFFTHYMFRPLRAILK